MSILVGRHSRVIVQGGTGLHGRGFTQRMLDYGTPLVGLVTPGKGRAELFGLPIYDTVREAVEAQGANASVVFVPPAACRDALLEAVDAGLGVVVCITDGVPVHDTMLVKQKLTNLPSAAGPNGAASTVLLGPNCPGIITPGEANLGIMPGQCYLPGRVGIVSRSGTLTYQTAAQLTELGIGQSTCLGIGGDLVVGFSFVQALAHFEADSQTDLIVLVGEIGGSQEERAAEFIQTQVSKPVVGYVAGKSAPPGKPMGHAGAIVEGDRGSYASKAAAFLAAEVPLADYVTDIGQLVEQTLRKRS
jgi:succinyl-CoA synthetase alpha subunit